MDPISEINNPATPPERLAELAQQHPELGAQIAAHPNAYPGLQEWIAQYAPTMNPEPIAQTAVQQPLAAGYVQDPAQAGVAPGVQPGVAPEMQVGIAPAAQPGGKRRGKVLAIVLSTVLVLLLAAGGGAWWFFGSKLGGSASPEAAAKKLVNSVTNLDALALYGSFAPSEFKMFEPASKNLLEAQAEDSDANMQELISKLEKELTVKTIVALETENDMLVEDEVERVTFTDGIIEIDGDPEKITDLVMDLYLPMVEAQMESAGYSLSNSELDEARDRMYDELDRELPFEIDFSELDISVVTVHESSGWFVSPLMTAADYAHKASGGSDSDLGDEIVPATTNGAKTPEAAAEQLTETIFAGDFDGFIEQMPLAERRVLSVYGEALARNMGINPDSLKDDMANNNAKLLEAKYSSTADGSTARVDIENLAYSTTSRDYWTDQDLEFKLIVHGHCVTTEGQNAAHINYYSSEYDNLYNDYYDDYFSSRSYISYDSWLRSKGYPEYEITDWKEEICPADKEEFAVLKALGFEEWSIIAVQEDGAWKITPIGTIADISAIATTRVSEAMQDGKLDSLFSN